MRNIIVCVKVVPKAEYFEEYSDALECFRNISEKYGLEDQHGTDFGSD